MKKKERIKELEQAVSTLYARNRELSEALRRRDDAITQLISGTKIGDFTRNDNGLADLIYRCTDAYVAEELRKHLATALRSRHNKPTN